MKKVLISSAVLVLFIMLLAVPANSQDGPVELQDPDNSDILIEPGDEAEFLAFANILPLDNEFEDSDMLGGRGNKRFFKNFDGKGAGRQWIHDSLNLTDEQKDKVKALRLNHQRMMIDLRANLQKAKLDARELRNDDKVSRSDVISSVEKMNKIKNEMALARANHKMDVYEVLTPAQKEIWQDLRDDFPRRNMINRGSGRMMDGSGFKRNMMR
ncbi:MAG: Spy/CpxP family protein refolding chaperone [Ignavibacteriaceae bacterium]